MVTNLGLQLFFLGSHDLSGTRRDTCWKPRGEDFNTMTSILGVFPPIDHILALHYPIRCCHSSILLVSFCRISLLREKVVPLGRTPTLVSLHRMLHNDLAIWHQFTPTRHQSRPACVYPTHLRRPSSLLPTSKCKWCHARAESVRDQPSPSCMELHPGLHKTLKSSRTRLWQQLSRQQLSSQPFNLTFHIRRVFRTQVSLLQVSRS